MRPHILKSKHKQCIYIYIFANFPYQTEIWGNSQPAVWSHTSIPHAPRLDPVDTAQHLQGPPWELEGNLPYKLRLNTPKWSFLVGKRMVVGYHHLRKPIFKYPRNLEMDSWRNLQTGRGRSFEMSLLKKIALYNSVVALTCFALTVPQLTFAFHWHPGKETSKGVSRTQTPMNAWPLGSSSGVMAQTWTAEPHCCRLSSWPSTSVSDTSLGHDPQIVSCPKQLLMENPESHQKIIPNAATCSRCHLVVINKQLIAEVGSQPNLPGKANP